MLYEIALVQQSKGVHLFALLFILLVLVICVVLVVFGLVVIFRAYKSNGRTNGSLSRPEEPPELLLARRFDAGVIDESEYRRRLNELRSREAPSGA